MKGTPFGLDRMSKLAASYHMDKYRRARLLLISLLVTVLTGGSLLTFPTIPPRTAFGQGSTLIDVPPIYLPFIVKPNPPCTTVVLRKGPQLILTGVNTEMRVAWQLDATLTATLEWGTDLQYSLGTTRTVETGPDHQHVSTLGQLAPGTRYYYRVIAGTACAPGTFYAAPPDTATSLKFFAYGDTRNGIATNDGIAGQIIAAYTADPAFQTFNLAVGDLVSDGYLESAWTDEFFNPHYPRLRAALASLSFLSVMGNHEGDGVLFSRYFPMPFVAGRYWSFDYGPAHVVMLDQYVPYEAGTTEYAWLAQDLAASQKPWKFIVLHEPGWSAGGGHPNNTTVQTAIQPLAEQYGVSIVFGGHNHYYARAVVNGIQHLTVGGGGAPLHMPDLGMAQVVAARSAYSFAKIMISGNVLTGTIVQLNGATIETFTVTR
jgi:hypothetical protein